MGMEILFANLDGRNAFLKNSNFDPYSRDKNINKMVILGSTEMRIPFPYTAFTYQSSIFQYLYATVGWKGISKNSKCQPSDPYQVIFGFIPDMKMGVTKI